MEQLFLIERYKSSEASPLKEKSDHFKDALDQLLSSAKKRQSEKSFDQVVNDASPRGASKHNHSCSPDEKSKPKTKKFRKNTEGRKGNTQVNGLQNGTITKQNFKPDVSVKKQIKHVETPKKDIIPEDDKYKERIKDEPECFTVIGQVEKKKKKQVTSILPQWLSEPVIISSNLQDEKVPVSAIEFLNSSLSSMLEKNGITHFFPVQSQVIPWVLKSLSSSLYFRPQDICVSAPTGSGKTLAYVVPIIQGIMGRLVPMVRALVILPVKDLAIQVYEVFQEYTKSTNLQVALIVGQKPHDVEAETLVRPTLRGGFTSLVDIVVCTPGSLIHHIHRTEGFSLHNLRFLVVDEADRLIDDIQEGWLSAVEKAIQSKKASSCQCRSKPISGRLLSGPIVPCCFKRPVEVCQKLLFSATLSQDPEKLKKLSLFCPKLFTAVAEISKLTNMEEGALVENFSTPEELTESLLICNPQLKPLIVWHLLQTKRYTNALCFTNTVDNSHRLTMLLKALGNLKVQEFSSQLSPKQRKSILNQFSNGNLDIVVCSDMMARGMDMNNVQCVICYDPPSYIKTYIHRIGRTARAGRSGTALSLLYREEVKAFKQVMKSAKRPAVKSETFDANELLPFEAKYQEALESVSKEIVAQEQKLKQNRNMFKKKKMHNS